MMAGRTRKNPRPWSGNQTTDTRMIPAEDDDDGAISAFFRTSRKLFRRVSGWLCFILILGLFYMGGCVVTDGVTSVYRGQTRMEVACDICGKPIREGFSYEITPFAHYTIPERIWRWMSVKTSDAITAVTAMASSKRNSQSNANPTPDADTNKNILDTPGSHYDLCPDCRERLTEIIKEEKNRH